MQVIAAPRHHQARSGLRPGHVIRIVIPALVLLYLIFQLSGGQLLMLALGGGLLAALFFRIGNMRSLEADQATHTFSKAGLDGGSLHHHRPAGGKTAGSRRIADGGSFERARPKRGRQAGNRPR